MDTVGTVNRRDFLKKAGGAVTAVSMAAPGAPASNEGQRPNILLIMTDQQSARMMSCAGNPFVRTPALDSLASAGVRFERAYCCAPVCIPSRFSLMTGRMPSEIGLRSNDLSHIDGIPDRIKHQGLGHLFRSAGYDAAYGGKVHLPLMNAEDVGFDYICRDERDELARVCADYITRHDGPPFLLVASFINPHDICYMAIRDFAEAEYSKRLIERGVTEIATLDEALRLPEGIGREEFFSTVCPPLPPNFEPQKDEPEAIRELLAQRPFRKSARERWTEERWRMHRWAYRRLTEMVDVQVGRVLDALRESGKEKNTLVVFTSDHGDMDSAHRMEHKTAFYEEASRIPLIARLPGVIPAGRVEGRHLVSNGLDLVPTLCDWGGIDVPNGLRGVSFRPAAEGRKPAARRDCIPVESELGRMIVTGDFKYALYDAGKNREQLYDLVNDPGETRNAAGDPGRDAILRRHRALFQDVFSGG